MRIIAVLFLFSTLIIHGRELNLEEVLTIFSTKSDFTKVSGIEKESIKIRKTGDLIDKWGGFRLEIQPQYNYFKDKRNNWIYWDNFDIETADSPVNNYTGNINMVVSYRGLYYRSFYNDYTDKVRKDRGFGSQEVGYAQNLNNLIYSDEKYRTKQIEYDEQNLKYAMRTGTKAEIDGLIDRYIAIKNLEIDIESRNNIYMINNEEIYNLKEKLRFGEGTELDIEYLEIENKDIEGELKILKENIKNEKKRLFSSIGLEYDENVNLKELSELKVDEINVEEAPAKVVDVRVKRQQEELKYLRRNLMPTIDMGGAYDLINERWSANLRFVYQPINFNTNFRLQEKNLEIIKLERDNEYKNLALEKERRKNEYENLIGKYNISGEKEENWRKKYEIADRVFKKGYIGVMEFIRIRDHYSEAQLNTKKAKNGLAAFRYKNSY